MDSIVNTEEAVIFWEAKKGAARGRPELPSVANLTATSERLSLLKYYSLHKGVDKASQQTNSISEKERKNTDIFVTSLSRI